MRSSVQLYLAPASPKASKPARTRPGAACRAAPAIKHSLIAADRPRDALKFGKVLVYFLYSPKPRTPTTASLLPPGQSLLRASPLRGAACHSVGISGICLQTTNDASVPRVPAHCRPRVNVKIHDKESRRRTAVLIRQRTDPLKALATAARRTNSCGLDDHCSVTCPTFC
jgi:hypothetical protein